MIESPATVAEAAAVPAGEPGRWREVVTVVGRWVVAMAAAIAAFSLLLVTKGADPLEVFSGMITSTFGNQGSVEQIVIKAAPMILAALAVVVPARAGLTNVGGEGQVVIGAVAAAGVGLALDQSAGGGLVLVAVMVAGAVGGALWAGLAAGLRLVAGVNETVTTVLLNYVALDVMLYLIYEPWKDSNGSGQPATRALAVEARLPLLGTTQVHVGIVLALVAAVGVWLVLRKTSFGFRLGVVGGNADAAARAGLPVRRLLLIALLLGGAFAGLAGAIQLAGVEFKLRPGFTANIGLLAFLASWLVRHRPLPVIGAALLLSAITVAGDSLQLDSGLPAATVHILTGLVLLAALGWTRKAQA